MHYKNITSPFLAYILTFIRIVTACQTCSFSNWHEWSTCSEECGGGIQHRQRSLCCPMDVPYDKCLYDLCKSSVNYNDTFETGVCNKKCFNGGTFDTVCVCPAGWTGSCCETPCDDRTFGVNCSQICKCRNGSVCNRVNGKCAENDSSSFLDDGKECQTCELGTWGAWGDCSQQCGGGVRNRVKDVCCPPELDYYTCIREKCDWNRTHADIFEMESCNPTCYNGGVYDDKCKCQPGWTGRCCQSHCDDGYYGDNCNSICDCPPNSKCEKATGICLQEIIPSNSGCDDGYYGNGCNLTCDCPQNNKCDSTTGACPAESKPPDLVTIISVAVAGFVIVQTLAVVSVILYRKGKRANVTEHLEKGKFWTEKLHSNPTLDLPENHYEEIPCDKKGHKSSIKKTSFRKGSQKECEKKKPEDKYQFLSADGEQCGYQTLVTECNKENAYMETPSTNLYMAVIDGHDDNQNKVYSSTAKSTSPATNMYNPEYLAMNGGTNSSGESMDETKGGYIAMSHQL